MIGTLFYGILFIASSGTLYAFGVFRILPYLADINAFSASPLSFAILMAACFGIAACMDRLFYYFDNGPVSYKHRSSDDVEDHPVIQALVLSILVSVGLFFLLGLSVKKLGSPYEETIQIERIAPARCSRYSRCHLRGAYVISGQFSGTAASIHVNHDAYETLKDDHNKKLFITGHNGIFGTTVESYKILE